MVKVLQRVSRVDAVRQGASHCLFVEGKDASRFDVPVLEALLRNRISIKPLGASFSVKSVAEALHPHHPDYYFLVDRDHHDDTMVEHSWRDFPDKKTQNLLIWRRRELESYLLISSYLARIGENTSSNLRRKKSRDEIDKTIRKACAKRVYLDAANQVIAEVREANKTKWIEFFKNPSELSTPEDARRMLTERPEFQKKRNAFRKSTSRKNLRDRFDAVLFEMTDGLETLDLERGNWLERIRAKKIWSTVVNQCFLAFDRNGDEIRGSEKAKQIALALVRLPLEEQPDDFRKLHDLILKCVTR